MTPPPFREILADTSAALRRDGNALSALAGLFIFLPITVIFWLILDSPMVRNATQQLSEAEMESLAQSFMAANGIWLFVASMLLFWGQLSIAAFCLDPARPTVGGALARGIRLLLPYLAVTIVVQLAVQLLAVPLVMLGGFGSIVLLAIAIFIGLRMFLFIAALAARGGGAIASLKQSWRMTGGDFWKLFLPFMFGLFGAGFLGMIALTLLTLPVSAFLGLDANIAATAFLLGLLMAVLALYALLFSISAFRALRD